jgi:hypothetical protein
MPDEKEYAVEVDIVTGEPIFPGEKQVNPDLLRHLEDSRAKADQLKSSLATEKGQDLLHLIQQQLATRINKLIDEDGECKALKKLLMDMGVTINLGERASERLLRMVMK